MPDVRTGAIGGLGVVQGAAMSYIQSAALAGAASGPLAPMVFAGAVIGQIVLMKVGAGRREADILTNPDPNNLGAQKIVEQSLDMWVWQFYEPRKKAGLLTCDDIRTTILAFEKIRDDFAGWVTEQGFTRAGPGAINTINHVVNDILLPDKRVDLANCSQFGPTVAGLLGQTSPVVQKAMNWAPLAGIMVGGVFFLRRFSSLKF